MENNMQVPQKLKIELLYDAAVPLLGIYTYCIIIHRSREWNTGYQGQG